MAYPIFYHPQVLKEDVAELNQDILNRIKKSIEERLTTYPEQYGTPLRKTLKGFWKIRVGDYRIVYRIEPLEVHILAIAHRRVVYEIAVNRIP